LSVDEEFRPNLRTFPARELKPNAEPVSPDEMEVGRVYFALQYLDPDLLVPTLYPMIFLGVDLDGEKRGRRYFQHFDSFQEGIQYGTTGQEAGHFEAYGPEGGKHIFEYERAIEMLMLCALWRDDRRNIDEQIRILAKQPPTESES
jgi:hypothetical protein